MTIRFYTSRHCEPCKEIADLVAKADLGEEVEIIDIDTDEGFERFTKEVLEQDDGAVPSAYKDGKRCIIGFDEQQEFAIECPTDAPPADLPG